MSFNQSTSERFLPFCELVESDFRRGGARSEDRQKRKEKERKSRKQGRVGYLVVGMMWMGRNIGEKEYL